MDNTTLPNGLRATAATKPGRRLVLAASTGGHLAQLAKLAPSLGASSDSLWITFDTPQSRSLLQGKNVLYVPYIAPRDWKGILHAYMKIRSELRANRRDYAEAISTGAALALAALPAARVQGIRARYIESVSRTQGPSLSGKILHMSRLAELQTQHEGWSRGRWEYRESVMNAFCAVQDQPRKAAPKIFVTLGTIKPYRFDAMVDAILQTGLVTRETTWQLGCTTRSDLPGTVTESVSDAAFEALIREADVVITHSGVGTILRILEAGKHPVVIPRRRARGEHVDDHQTQIASLVSGQGLATAVEVDSLTSDIIQRASEIRILERGDAGCS